MIAIQQTLNLSSLTNLNSFEKALHERALINAAKFRAAEADMLNDILEVDRTRLYVKFDLTSSFAYCTKILKLSEDVACNFIKVARTCRRVPELKSAIEQGEIGISKARKISTVISSANQSIWLEKAKSMPQARLEREVAKVNPAQAVIEKTKYVSETRLKLELGISEDFQKLLTRAQDLVSRSQGRTANYEQTLERALKDLIEKRDPIERAGRAQEKAAKRARQVAEKKSEKNLETKIDASVRAGRQPLPAFLKHVVYQRDEGQCRYVGTQGQICGATRWTDIHHVIPVSQGGLNEPDNLITLCSHHHRLLHGSYPS